MIVKSVGINIDGQNIDASVGETLLETARRVGIYIPNLCSYSGLKPLPQVMPDMACQLCLVEADGKIVLSCDTKPVEGMRVTTETPKIREIRRRKLSEILRRHPHTFLTYDRKERCEPFDTCLRTPVVEERDVLRPINGACELQKAIDQISIKELPRYIDKKLPKREDSPVFLRDHNLCILCERCVRVCDDIRGARAIEFAFPCHRACPSGIDIPRYIRLIARGLPNAALSVIREKVPFPGVLGRVCIHPCEAACQRGLVVDKLLQIRMLKRFAADNSDDSWKKQSKKLAPTGKRVAVVGAGPAGLTAGYYLTKLGHYVTVFEALSKPGGMMMVGIPEYRLPRNVLDSEIGEIRNAGVEIKLNTRIKSPDSLLEQGYDAVFLGVGAHQGIRLGVSGEELPGVIESVEFLRRGNLGERINVGARVGIIGGGNVAIDAARMSLRFGAKKVTIFYRRTRAEMPASPEEVEASLQEGIECIFLAAPSKVSRENHTLKLECIRMKLGEPDTSGRARPIPIQGSEFTTELDTLLVAIGQHPQVPAEFQVEVDKGNVIKVDASMRTSRKGIYSGGDCVSGPASVIEAIAAGRKAAEAIDCYLGGKGDISESLVPVTEATTWLEQDLPEEKLAAISHLPVESRVRGFDEVEQPWDWNTARAEAQRCLRCYVITPPDEKILQDANCQFCGACVDACPTGALVERSIYGVGVHGRMVTTICPYCGVGCQLMLEIKDSRILRVVPDPAGPANWGQACVKGKFGLDFVTDPSRLTEPLVRKGDKLVKSTWDEALDLIATKLGRYEPDEVAVISSARCTNEDNYVIQKFTRAVLGTNTIDHCARL